MTSPVVTLLARMEEIEGTWCHYASCDEEAEFLGAVPKMRRALEAIAEYLYDPAYRHMDGTWWHLKLREIFERELGGDQ